MPALGLPLALPYLNYTYARGGGGGAAAALVDDDFGSVEALVPMRSIQTTGGNNTFDHVYGNRWEVNGDVSVDGVNTLFGISTLEFDGTGDYLFYDVSDYSAVMGLRFDPTDDFTVECWVNIDATGRHNFFHRSVGSTSGVYFETNASTILQLVIGGTTGYVAYVGTTTLSVDTWYHVAAVRDGSDIKVFLDGDLESTTAITGTPGFSSTTDAYIGRNPTDATRDLDGNMAWFRWTQGVARYTGSFTAPTEGFPAQTEVGTDPFWDDVILLIQPDEEPDASTTYTDLSGTASSITANGNSQIDTESVAFFNSPASIYNENNDSNNTHFEVLMPAGPATLDGDFTIEVFYHDQSTGAGDNIFDSTNGLTRYFGNNIAEDGDGTAFTTPSASLTAPHRKRYGAMVRSGTALSWYIDGTLVGTETDATTWDISEINFGWLSALSSREWLGYFGPIRITKGVARGVSKVPTAPFPTSNPTTEQSFVIPSSVVGSDLTGFVTRLDLTGWSTDFWGDIDSDGGNIRIYDSNDTRLPIDITHIDTGTEEAEIFFRADLSSSSDNHFTLKLDGDGLALASGSYGREATWQDYEFVAVFSELINRVDGSTLTVTGTQGTGLPNWFNADDAAHIVYSGLSADTTHTMGASFILDTLAGGNQAVLSWGDGNTERTTLAADRSSGDTALWNTTDSWLTGGTAPTVDVLRRVVGRHDGTTARHLIIDGVVEGTDAGCAAKPSGGGTPDLYIGVEDGTLSERLHGKTNYVYVRGDVLSDDWLAAEWESWHTTNFIVIS